MGKSLFTFKFVMWAGLMATAMAGFTSAVSAGELSQQGQATMVSATGQAPQSSEYDHWELFKSLPNETLARGWARFYQGQGYQTDIRQEGGFYNVYCYVAD